jgi:hypothetical protein
MLHGTTSQKTAQDSSVGPYCHTDKTSGPVLPRTRRMDNAFTYNDVSDRRGDESKGKVIPVTGCEGAWGYETIGSRMAVRFSALRDGKPPFTPRKIPCTHFCRRLGRPLDHSAAGRIRSTGKSSNLIGNQTRDHPTCSIVS